MSQEQVPAPLSEGKRRSIAAFEAMEKLGIKRKIVKPVLKRLLKVSGFQWEFVENENYSVLADAIFDDQDPQGGSSTSEELPMENGHREKRLKSCEDPTSHNIIIRNGPTCQPSPPENRSSAQKRPFVEPITPSPVIKPVLSLPSSSGRLLVQHKPELSRARDGETGIKALVQHKPEKFKARDGDTSNKTPLVQHKPAEPSRVRDGEPSNKALVQHKPTEPSRARDGETNNKALVQHKPAEPSRARDGETSNKVPVQFKPEPLRARDGEMRALVQHKPEGVISSNIAPHKPDRLALTCRSERDDLRIGASNGTINSSERKNIGISNIPPLAILYPDSNNQGNSSRRRVDKGKAKVTDIAEPPDQSTNLGIASNESKDVNISFMCNDTILTDPNFHPPSIEEICQQVEAKFMSSYRILNPNFSLLNIFSEMCKSFKELGYTPLNKRNNQLIKIVPAPGAEHLFQGITGYSSSNPTFNTMALVPFNVPIPPHDHEDISRGLENVRISIKTDPGSKEEYPPIFQYISTNIPYQNAYVSISLARIGDDSCCSECHGDCIQSPFPCACAAETGGCFAYTKDGLLRKEFLEACMERWRNPKRSDFFFCKEMCPLERVGIKGRNECKGHLMKKFIKECWAKCGCKLQCGNRVVQRGITCNLQIFKASEEIGWGIRTLDFLRKGSFVCEYVGVVLTNIELYERQRGAAPRARHTYPVLLDADWTTEGILKDEEALCLDATHYGNVARFINHRCHDGNLIGIPVEIETPDHHYYHLAFFTNRDVPSMEELTWDYGIDFNDHNHPIKAFQCKCGSPYCRDVKRQQITKTRAKPPVSSKFVLG